MMRRYLLTALLLGGLLVLASPSWALLVYPSGYPNLPSVDVGVLDRWIASGNPSNSGYNTELDWVNDQLVAAHEITEAERFTSFDKNDYAPAYYNVFDGANILSNVYAFQFEDQPEYFMVKFGNANSFYSTVLWANNANLDWAVIDLTGRNVLGITALSHFGEFGGGTPVPEPATLLLLGTGMIGLAFAGRKKLLTN